MKEKMKLLKSFINVRLIPSVVKYDDLFNVEINPMIDEGNLNKDENVLDKVFLIALSKLLGEIGNSPSKEMPDQIGVTWSQNSLRKGYCIHMQGSIPRAILWRYFEPEKTESPSEKGLTFEDLMLI